MLLIAKLELTAAFEKSSLLPHTTRYLPNSYRLKAANQLYAYVTKYTKNKPYNLHIIRSKTKKYQKALISVLEIL